METTTSPSPKTTFSTDDLDVNIVFGEPETIGAATVVPVTEVILGLGTGPSSTEAPDVATGGGGHVRTRPLATIEVGPEGTRVQPVVDTQKVALAGLMLSIWVFGWIGLVLNTLLNRDA